MLSASHFRLDYSLLHSILYCECLECLPSRVLSAKIINALLTPSEMPLTGYKLLIWLYVYWTLCVNVDLAYFYLLQNINVEELIIPENTEAAGNKATAKPVSLDARKANQEVCTLFGILAL